SRKCYRRESASLRICVPIAIRAMSPFNRAPQFPSYEIRLATFRLPLPFPLPLRDKCRPGRHGLDRPRLAARAEFLAGQLERRSADARPSLRRFLRDDALRSAASSRDEPGELLVPHHSMEER